MAKSKRSQPMMIDTMRVDGFSGANLARICRVMERNGVLHIGKVKRHIEQNVKASRQGSKAVDLEKRAATMVGETISKAIPILERTLDVRFEQFLAETFVREGLPKELAPGFDMNWVEAIGSGRTAHQNFPDDDTVTYDIVIANRAARSFFNQMAVA